jgi:hypothetical protein
MSDPIPAEAALIAPKEELAFLHCHSVDLAAPMTPLQAWDAIMSRSLPGLATAFRIRDAISARFGVKRIGGFSRTRARDPVAGERLDFFLVEAISHRQLVLTERDRHLDVMTSVLSDGTRFSIVSSVKTHNAFGRAYMVVVGPAHRLIVWAMMRRLVRSNAAS